MGEKEKKEKVKELEMENRGEGGEGGGSEKGIPFSTTVEKRKRRYCKQI